MLRPIKSSMAHPRVWLHKFTNDGSDSIDDVLTNKISHSYTGDSLTDYTFTPDFRRGNATVASVGTDVADGGFASTDVAATASDTAGGKIDTTNTAGSADAGTVYAASLGYESINASPHRVRQYDVLTNFMDMRVLGFRVDGTGTASILEGAFDGTLVDNGTGDYTITFKSSFGNASIWAFPTVVGATAAYPIVEAISSSSVNITTFNSSGAAVDADFHLVVMGSFTQTLNPAVGMGSILKGTQRQGRLLMGRLINTAGVPSIGMGTGDFTVADTGTGRWDVTFTNPFARVPIVIATGDNNNMCQIDNVSSTVVDLASFDDSGSATDAGMNFLVYGFDSAASTGIFGA